MKHSFDISYYFSDEELIKILCRKRAILAKQGHDLHFLRNISDAAKTTVDHQQKHLYSLFPPRSEWIRLNRSERGKKKAPSLEVNALQLLRTTTRAIKRFKLSPASAPLWLSSLLHFTSDIRNSVMDASNKYEIATPTIIPIVKDAINYEYRPLCVYELKDLIIISQVSKYLSNCFDQLFFDCSYAFRTGINTEKQFNHHQAIADLIAFKKPSQSYYVAECDIKKFYDCVNHSVIKKRFDEFVLNCTKKLNIDIHERARHIFQSYLKSFSFNNTIKKNEKAILKKRGYNKGEIPWVKASEFTSIGVDCENEKIGVPQGGALSCLIANMILHDVDQSVLRHNDGNMFYARFCDDMVLLLRTKSKCTAAFVEYQNALKRNKLISHTPFQLTKYDSTFWDSKAKSKSPYRWDKYSSAVPDIANVPWLSFVGYQVRYDGLTRIRKSSIKKELLKQVQETDQVISIIRKTRKPRLSGRAIVFRLQQRLISMAVGRTGFGSNNSSMCWCSGFNIARDNQNIKSQFKKLDRNRERQVQRLRRYCRTLANPRRRITSPPNVLNYYGKPFSYYHQFNLTNSWQPTAKLSALNVVLQLMSKIFSLTSWKKILNRNTPVCWLRKQVSSMLNG